jgi:D-beta-D-heptose 7-phosphate kinase/D-beta-D-heptose 1-phosphate adenosyltransferase
VLEDHPPLFSNLTSVHILCIGDVMLDTYIRGHVERISPEAPVPVLKIDHVNHVLGGAGNVVRNVLELGVRVSFMGVIGNDQSGSHIRMLLSQEGGATPYLYVDHEERVTSHKTRFVAQQQQLLRADAEAVMPVVWSPAMEQDLQSALEAATGVILSDYAKGMLSGQAAGKIIAACHHKGVPVFVDPKGLDWGRYKGATLLTPNQKELSAYVGYPLKDEETLVKAARDTIHHLDLQGILVTRSSEGMTLVMADKPALTHRTKAVEVFDVSGAGDTVISALAAFYSAGSTMEQATHIANIAAGIVVGKTGTAPITLEELSRATQMESFDHKILPLAMAKERVQKLRRNSKIIGFTNGCFDLLHQGHLSLLLQAKSQCDHLIVGLNTDASVRTLKGQERPIQDEQTRASILAALAMVDAVILFEEETPEALIHAVQPDVLIKGADYRADQVVGADYVIQRGGRVFRADLMPGKSTTSTVNRLKGLPR